MKNTSSGFRLDINGLRAIAVIAVVLFHFNSSWLPGGFAGVDVFFVISGFLMTKIIYTGMINGNFDFWKFYSARAKRITPALAVACTFVLIFGWFYISRQDFVTLSKHVGSSLFFFSNFMYWAEAGYFDIASKSKFLLHTWSLSVEWQFYLIYPFIIMTAIAVAGKRFARYIILCLALLSLAFCVFSSFRWPDASYFLLPSRSWEMLSGGVVFLFPVSAPVFVRKLMHYSGLALIFAAYVFFSESDVWPGYLSAIPVLGAMLLISAAVNDDSILSNRVTQSIGSWSYSIYLWHWVILSIIYFFNPFYDLHIGLIGIVASFAAGYLSYNFVESRKSLSLSFKVYVPLTLATLIIFANIDFVQKIRDLTAQYDTKDWVRVYKDFKDSDMGGDYWVPCAAGWQMVKNHRLSVDEKCIKNKGSGGVFVLGDSHAAAISVGIRGILKNGVPYNQLATPGCMVDWSGKPSKINNKSFAEGCDYQNKISMNIISEIKPSVVFIIKAERHELAGFDLTAKKMKQLGVKKIIVLGPVPQWMPSLPIALSKPKKVMGNYLISNSLRSDIFKTNDAIREQYKNSNDVIFGDILSTLCHKVGTETACRYRADNHNLMTFDYGHPTDFGANVIAQEVIKPIMPKELIN
ncbi:TPA: acyltransferase [Escherichia coli]|nr:acyltransferase [Escherichia coli]